MRSAWVFSGCRRFVFEQEHICGVVVSMQEAVSSVLQCHHYPTTVSQSLTECLIASVLLSSRFKERGELTLQLNGGGAVRLLVAKCSADLAVRGVAQYDLTADQSQLSMDFSQGNLVVSFNLERASQPTQSIVALQGLGVVDSLQYYFLQSEQIPTLLNIDHERCLGLMLQRMPHDGEPNNQLWDSLRQQVQAFTLQAQNGTVEDVLISLFAEQNIRLFEQRPVKFSCVCCKERMQTALLTLTNEDLQSLLHERESVDMQCEYCLSNYQFSAQDIQAILRARQP
jgi:molecular chaperone Hsp33